ncbi:type I-E CRISPR-associated protein Cse1/CasA [Streptosporangium sp. NPDC000239]|uniref:type I-E CRISPR-associated protein Cse1/CasA n=1 Tax=Streptosporangium sp. NPDC000239 TaxID=3154248 RepID=UPI00333308A5
MDPLLTVDVVLFRATRNGRFVPVGADLPLDLTDPAEPTEDLLRALDGASVSLAAGPGLPAEVVRAVAATPVPRLFQSSSWLYRHRAVILTDNKCAVGGHVLHYTDLFGLYVTEVEPESAAVVTAKDTGTKCPAIATASFDLLTRPWIPVVGDDGETRQLGLRDVVLNAHTIRQITAETPTMTAALHRFLLAFFHRVYGPESEEAWQELWTTEQLPTEALDTYLHRHRHRFDLFHPEVPFMQCAKLASLTPATAAKLVPYRAVGNNVTLFDHTTAADRVTLSPQEAARWLVTVQAFDPGGMKTPYEKDKSSERAPCNDFGVVVVEGENLKETLLLNALVYLPDHQKPMMTAPDDRPVWEEETGPSPRPDKRTARGWTDLLTWPSRRVLLSATGSGENTLVEGVVITPGTRLDASLIDEEWMAAFRRPRDAKGKFKKSSPILPVRLHPLRGIWRHSVELLLTDVWEEGRNRRRPAALDQIAELAERRLIPLNAVYTLRVFGQRLDSKASVIEAWMEEQVPAPVPLLRAKDENLGAIIGHAIALADDAGSALRSFQAEYRKDFRDTTTPDIDHQYWPRLSRPFGAFLVALGDARDNDRSELPAIQAWARQVKRLAATVADRWVAGSPARGRAMVALGKHHGVFHSRLAVSERTFHAKIFAYTTGKEGTDV